MMQSSEAIAGAAMNDDDDEIWDDEDKAAGRDEQYDAMLVDVQDQTSSYGRATIDAASVNGAIGKAREWAQAECQKIGKRARLIVTGGGIHGSHSEVIEP
jgi:hypothetical protein